MEESNLVNYAKHELEIVGLLNSADEYDRIIASAALELVRKFSEQGHSGFSAPMVIGMVSKLMAFKPLTPLTGEDSEWNEVGTNLWQNNRCSNVFKSTERGAYDIEGKVFRDPDGSCWTNSESIVPVVFPYTPKTEYVDRK